MKQLQRRTEGKWTHGERCDVSDNGGGHGGGTTPDRITEEKPVKPSVGAADADANATAETQVEVLAIKEGDSNRHHASNVKVAPCGHRWWEGTLDGDEAPMAWRRRQTSSDIDADSQRMAALAGTNRSEHQQDFCCLLGATYTTFRISESAVRRQLPAAKTGVT